MEGVDPLGYMQQVARRLDQIDDPKELETLLDEIEYLFEILDPEFQELAYDLVDRMRARLSALQ